MAITRRERYALLAIRRMFDVFMGTPFAEDVEALLAKVLQRTTATERAELAADRDRFKYIPDGGTKAHRGKEDVIDALQTGVLMRRVVKYAYRGGRGRASRGYLAPFSLVVFKHGPYVIGRRLDDPAVGPTLPPGPTERYAGERFTEAEALRARPFSVPVDFRSKTSSRAASRSTAVTRPPATASSSGSAKSARRTRASASGTARRRSRTSPTARCSSRSPARTSRPSCRGSSNGGHTPARSLRLSWSTLSSASWMQPVLSTGLDRGRSLHGDRSAPPGSVRLADPA